MLTETLELVSSDLNPIIFFVKADDRTLVASVTLVDFINADDSQDIPRLVGTSDHID
jgi:hypothetical protein